MSRLREYKLSYNLNQIVVVVNSKLRHRGKNLAIVSASSPIPLLYFEAFLIAEIEVFLTSKNRMKYSYKYYKAGQTDISLI